jgi:hypothetical protein
MEIDPEKMMFGRGKFCVMICTPCRSLLAALGRCNFMDFNKLPIMGLIRLKIGKI